MPKLKKYTVSAEDPLMGGASTPHGSLMPEGPESAATSLPGSAPAAQAKVTPKAQDTKSPSAPAEKGGDKPSGKADPMAEVKAENLTGRQLRMARRLAQKHGIDVADDYEAVVKLRAQGIDPFERASMLALAQDDLNQSRGKELTLGKAATAKVPATDVAPPTAGAEDMAARMADIQEIQRDIARRRRRRLMLLAMRLLLLVLLPTILVSYYYFARATPMYATESEVVIQQADGQSLGGNLLSGTALATSQDAMIVQSYLQSRDAMLRLENSLGFREHFQSEDIDPIQRLPQEATIDETYKLYKKRVVISFDPTEGIIRMEVIAPTPELAQTWAEALISYAEEQVDGITNRKRSDQMLGAEENFADAEAKLAAAQGRVLSLQEQLGVLDPRAEGSAQMGQITRFETQLEVKRLALEQLLDNARPNQARVEGLRGDISRLEDTIVRLRSGLTETQGNSDSLARMSAQLSSARIELETRTMVMQEALRLLEAARVEANRQVRYLAVAVKPIPPEEPSYPKAFENTFVTLFIFAGIYLMISLTASILREQVSA